jgi:ferric-dicitrate binding protein FerR (iron transport regulator)
MIALGQYVVLILESTVMEKSNLDQMLEIYLRGDLSASQLIKLDVWHTVMQTHKVEGRSFNRADEEALFHMITSESSTLDQIRSFRPYHYRHTPLLRKLRFQVMATLILILAIGSTTWYLAYSRPLEKTKEQLESLILDAGITVTMTKGSTLSYYQRHGRRFLSFKGQALVDIDHGSACPFTIRCGNDSLIVHGGQVSLRSDPRGCEMRVMSYGL